MSAARAAIDALAGAAGLSDQQLLSLGADLGWLALAVAASDAHQREMLRRVGDPDMSDAEVMTSIIEWPPGSAGAPPHRHPGGPAFGYVLEGEMLFELEGEAP